MKHRLAAHQEHSETWLITYSDMVTLLMALFIVLLSVSKVDQNKAEEMTEAMSKSVTKKSTAKKNFHDIKDKIDKMVQDNHLEKQVNAKLTPRGIDIEFSSSVFFAPGRGDLLAGAVPILSKTSTVLQSLKLTDVVMNVEGHTDDAPIATAQFPSNWELSTARATMVVRALIDKGVNKKILQAIGKADTDPKVPNRDKVGKPIAANQAANRRVVIRLIRG